MTRVTRAKLAILLVVALATACSKSRGPSPASSEVRAASGSGGSTATAGPDQPADCRACALKSMNRNCGPAYLTAQRDKSGEPVPDTFGCGTLVTPAAREACGALLTCINKNRCPINPVTKAAPGDNAVQGCYCGAKTSPQDCLTGTGISGPCAAQYHAAVTATNAGPAADAKEAAFAGFIGPRAFDATTPFGLADNIVTCAVDAPCPACNGL